VEVAKECRALTHANALPFCKLLNSTPNAPITDEFIVQLFSIPIKTTQPVVLKDLLFEKYKIEIPVMPHENKVFLRYSIQAYNTQQDLDILTDAIKDIIKTTNLIEI
jgi:isopenicillin-N epimerase